MQRYVVAYDISSDKRRKKIGEVLEAYGQRVNYSVFEIQVKSEAQKRTLENEILALLNPKIDSFRIYHVCQNCVEKSWSLGEENAPFEKNAIYFF